jgi:Cobalamin biosynthesis protein CobT (nicotinate-mononucleotide:5, 6-dimethylbenzimidazole phosphoribosyltransferase)
MDLWKATEGYEPYTDEFDAIANVQDLVTRERAIEILKFMGGYRAARIDRPAFPEDPYEAMIALRNQAEESDLLSGIPHGAPRKHLIDFGRAVKDLRSTIREEFSMNDLDPSEVSVTMLVENSGSTRGELAYHIAMSAIEMCSALDGIGAETGVLGYTTASWKGGRSFTRWKEDGRPANPGRLEDLLHIVYKRPDEAMDDTALVKLHMLAEPRLRKENIFGEGLMWGATAAASTSRKTKLLIHVVNKPISVSQATFEADTLAGEKFRRHQEAVISEIDDAGEIAMSLVMLAPQDAMLETFREHRAAMGRMVVMAEGDGRADQTLQAFRSGLSACLERAATLQCRVEP